MNGIVTGGWDFVWAAYIITALVLSAFTGRAWFLERTARRGQ
jgi:hypothetical protein